MLALQQGRPESAEGIAQEILSRNAGDVGAMYVLGHALMQQKRHEEAIAPLERAAQQSRDPAVHTALGVALRQVGASSPTRRRS
jgi:Flp pilus assembly protein TadD